MYYENLNPFSFLVESTSYLLSRIKRSSYIQRTIDSFRVFNGVLLEESGIVDYLLLQLPNLLAHATVAMFHLFQSVTGIGSKEDSLDNKSLLRRIMPSIILIPVGIILAAATLLLAAMAAAFTATKALLSLVLAIPSHLFVALTHLLTLPGRLTAEDKIDQLSVAPTPRAINNKLLSKAKNAIFDTINIKNQTDAATREQGFKAFMFRFRNINHEELVIKPMELKGRLALAFYANNNLLEKPAAVIKTTEQNKEGISALIRYNYFRTTENFESAGKLDQLERQIGLSV